MLEVSIRLVNFGRRVRLWRLIGSLGTLAAGLSGANVDFTVPAASAVGSQLKN